MCAVVYLRDFLLVGDGCLWAVVFEDVLEEGIVPSIPRYVVVVALAVTATILFR